MSMTTKQKDERIASLEAELAATREREERVREYWFPWKDHPVGDHLGVTVRTHDGKLWAVLLEHGLGEALAWTGDEQGWVAQSKLLHGERYLWTLDEAETKATDKAEFDGRAKLVGVSRTVPEIQFADRIDRIIQASKEAVEDFTGESYERIYARLGVAS